jgi:hypothetical protein
MVKAKTFSVRCTPEFLDNVKWLAKEMGVSQGIAVEIAVNTYPAVVKMMQRHEEMLAKLKDTI